MDKLTQPVNVSQLPPLAIPALVEWVHIWSGVDTMADMEAMHVSQPQGVSFSKIDLAIAHDD